MKNIRSCQRSPKNVGSKDESCNSGSYGIIGTVPVRLKGNLKHLGVDTSIVLIQKSALLDSAKILNNYKVLEMRRKDRILIGFRRGILFFFFVLLSCIFCFVSVNHLALMYCRSEP